MGFNPTNSARSITQGLTQWKSRALPMKSRHRGTMNFGDICPLNWFFTLPQDKIKCDYSGVFKFMPLWSPALVDCKVKVDWFWVPLKLIAPHFRRMLQNWHPGNSADLQKMITNNFSTTQGYKVDSVEVKFPEVSSNSEMFSGNVTPPYLPAYAIALYMADTNINTTYSSSSPQIVDPNGKYTKWRSNTSSGMYQMPDGFEDVDSFAVHSRASKLMGYLGLPKILTTMRYNRDIVVHGSYTLTPDFIKQDGDYISDYADMDPEYLKYAYYPDPTAQIPPIEPSGSFATHFYSSPSSIPTPAGYFFASMLPSHVKFNSSNQFQVVTNFSMRAPLTTSNQPVSLLPFMAYQTIYNKFYRDQKIMKDEIRTYSDCSFFEDHSYRNENPYHFKMQYNIRGGVEYISKRFFNNLFGLRRHNYAKDLHSTSYPDSMILVNSNDSPINASNVNLLTKFRKFLLKKEMTGSDFFQFLNNFFGTRGADYLTDNVVHLGSSEDQVIISENIQDSSTTETSAQGNRAGKMDAFGSGREVYFEAPDFGVVMCNVTLMPDFPTNYNGLDPRWSLVNPIDWNFVDLQNIGFTTLRNSSIYLNSFDGRALQLSGSTHFSFASPNNSDSFGYQPFGFAWTYQPDIISGDLRTSLKFWHQSPDYSDNLTERGRKSEKDYQRFPQLNLNFPAVGRRFIPGSSTNKADLSAQYYNNIFAVTNDVSGDHCIFDINFDCLIHRHTAFFTDGLPDEQ